MRDLGRLFSPLLVRGWEKLPDSLPGCQVPGLMDLSVKQVGKNFLCIMFLFNCQEKDIEISIRDDDRFPDEEDDKLIELQKELKCLRDEFDIFKR